MRAVNGAVTATDIPYSCWASHLTLGKPSSPSRVGSVSRSHYKSLKARRPSIAGTRVRSNGLVKGGGGGGGRCLAPSHWLFVQHTSSDQPDHAWALSMTLRKDGKALNFLDPGFDHVIHATFNETGLTQWCTKAESTLGSDLHSSVHKHCFHILELLWFYNEPRLLCIGSISVKWTLFHQGVPPQTKGCLFLMTGMQQGKRAPQSMPPFNFEPGKSLWSRWPPDSNKKKTGSGFFWSKPNLCWLVQQLLDRTNNSDHGGSCLLITPVHF